MAEKAAAAAERALAVYQKATADAAQLKESARLLQMKAAEDREKLAKTVSGGPGTFFSEIYSGKLFDFFFELIFF